MNLIYRLDVLANDNQEKKKKSNILTLTLIDINILFLLILNGGMLMKMASLHGSIRLMTKNIHNIVYIFKEVLNFTDLLSFTPSPHDMLPRN